MKAQEGDWIKCYEDETLGIEVYYDSETVKYKNDNVYVWELTKYNGVYDSYGYIDYDLKRIELSCISMKYKILSVIAYYTNGKKLVDYESTDYYIAEPGSFRANLISILCK